jgi:hypothetical protein
MLRRMNNSTKNNQLMSHGCKTQAQVYKTQKLILTKKGKYE